MINRIVLVGRLVADPEVRETNDGSSITKFRIAVDRTKTNEDGEKITDFFNVVCFRRTAEFAAQYLRKAHLVGVDGRCQIDQYTDRDGVKRTWIEVAADSVQSYTTRTEAEAMNERGEEPTAPSSSRQPAREPAGAGGRRKSFGRGDDAFQRDDDDPFADQ